MNKYIRIFNETDVINMRLLPAFDHNAATVDTFLYEADGQACYTILSPNGEIMACVTGQFLKPHVFHAFALVDVLVKKYPVHYIKQLRKIVSQAFKHFDILRLQIHVRSDQYWALGFAHAIGFECEGILRRYGFNGVDMLIFSKVR